MTLLHNFKNRHDLSIADLAAILCVSDSTVRKYLARRGAAMHRKLNPVAAAMIGYIEAREISLDLPIIREAVQYDPAEFDRACGSRSNPDVAAALSSDRTTVYRWRTDLTPRATACKFVMLMNAFGWPDAA